MMNTATTIRVNGRDFSVTSAEHAKEGVQYTLRGARGAVYKTMRNVNRPAMMFLVDARGFGIAMGKTPTWLTDASGALEAVR